MRASGVLMHISSLPGPGGIGCLGREAYSFVDFLAHSGQKYWQVLPLGPPARGNSPYSSLSAFAGNPLFIDIQSLARQGVLPESDYLDLPRESEHKADFEAAWAYRLPLLRKAFHRGRDFRYAREIASFRKKHAFWLEDYALFMALRESFEGASFHIWPERFRLRDPEAIKIARADMEDEIGFWVYVQYLFFEQWQRLRAYARKKGVRIIGDMPIYADIDSADCWSNPDIFQLDEELAPTAIAGVPPDAFSKTGQLWGNPLYEWNTLRITGYRWWKARVRMAQELFDTVRIDHFRALESYWAVPAGARTAEAGKWRKGPGIGFVRAIKRAAPKLDFIAEDLGLLTPAVHRLLEKSGFPGMRVLLFAFDPKEESAYLPHNLPRGCVCYVGTHDNDTARSWLEEAPRASADFARRYLNLAPEREHWGFIRAAYASPADLVIVQMQDFLGLGGDARMNVPGVAEGNWGWRLRPNCLSHALARKVSDLAKVYFR